MHRPPIVVTAALSLGLILNQVAIMALPAIVVTLAADWTLSGSDIGWLGGIYFAGFAAAVPFLTGAAERMDGRVIYTVSALIGAGASLGFALFAEGFWSALVLRLLSGAGLAGAHIVGMKLLADRLDGPAQARASGIYSGAYVLGSGLSFLIAGILAEGFGWPAAFLAASIAALLSVPLMLLLGSPLAGSDIRTKRFFPNFAAAWRHRGIRKYVLAYAGNTWEVFAIRVWFVPVLAFNAALPDQSAPAWNPAVLSGVAAIAAIPVSLAVVELGLRFGRDRAIIATAGSSIAVCIAIGALATGSYFVLLGLLFLHSFTSYGDTGSIIGGMVAAANPEERNGALALFGVTGFTSGFVGPLAVGIAYDLAGGATVGTAWLWAFAVMAVGSAISAAVVAAIRQPA